MNEGKLQELVNIMKALRAPDGCPWDKIQTHKTLKKCSMEECAELAQAASKMRRAVNTGNDTEAARYNLIEEAADVLICIRQMQELYGISDHDIQVMVDRKCRRQEARL